jgi:mRNA-degrading endonuclease toxin of MazEF toxin-antitoxin module
VVNENGELPVVLAVHLVDDGPGSLLAVRVGEHGWARALSIEPVMRRRLAERVGVADDTTMERVANALRAVQDL